MQDNIRSEAQMQEFVGLIASRGVPLPSVAARLSVYTQIVCGISILSGAFIRLTSIPFIINFAAAIVIAHLDHTFAQMFPALLMIAAGLFFLFHGTGQLSVGETSKRS